MPDPTLIEPESNALGNSSSQRSSRQKPSLIKRLRRFLIGSPLDTEHMEHTLLNRLIALPVFASDAISSCAYATQEITLVLGAAGLGAASAFDIYRKLTVGVAFAIIVLLVIVATSYWQTIFAYPGGGGSYIVTKENVGKRFKINWGLVAGASLLIDYVLTVSVSVAAGIQNLSGLPFILSRFHLDVNAQLVPICILCIAMLTLANLRGLKESGALFAVVTYGFVVACLVIIAVNLFGSHFGYVPQLSEVNQIRGDYAAEFAKTKHLVEAASLGLLLHAFSSGCTAMTGVEAVSNGIPAFKEPKSRNAALTLLTMAAILGTIFLGLSITTMQMKIVYFDGASSVIDQISGATFGKEGKYAFFYIATQLLTAGILVLAANTAFADFPRLASIMAKDRFLPKQFANLGDRLVFKNGIGILGIFAGLLIIGFKGKVDNLIPLYAVGVFLAFTLSQTGMVIHWFHERQRGWRKKAIINGIGAVATLIVLATIVYEKFAVGAWIIVVLIVVLYLLFNMIHNHYLSVAQQLNMKRYQPSSIPMTNTVLLLVPSLHRGIMPALTYAKSLSPDCRAIHIETSPERTPIMREKWEYYGQDVPLVILNSKYRSLIGPIMQYLDAVQLERRNHLVTVIVPEFVPTKKWHALLHGNNGLLLKLALLARRDIVVANVRYYLQELEERPGEDVLSEEETASPGTQNGASSDH